MGIAQHHDSGQSFDDATALITASLGDTDTAALREQVRPILADGTRAVACLEMLAVCAAGWVEALATETGRPAEDWLAGVALRDLANRPR